jgi:excisionase family DNA binding protein
MDYLTCREAGSELGVSAGRVHQLIDAGRLKATKKGPILLIRRRDLDAVRVRKNGRPRKEQGHAKA